MDRIRKLFVLFTLAAMVALPFVLLPYVARNQTQPSSPRPSADARRWVAAAAGRVEPRAGEFHIGATTIGRIIDVLVRAGDRIEAGDLLLRLDDREQAARVAAALAEAAMRKVTRDARGATGQIKRRQDSDDAIFNAEQRVVAAHAALDRAVASRRTDASDDVAAARAGLREADAQLAQERETAVSLKIEGTSDIETALNVARSQLTLAQAAFDQTRIRASVSGTVLQVTAKLGEIATPAAPLIVVGDLTSLQVRAEVEERDIAKIHADARVVVRADAFPDTSFDGRVTTIAPGLTRTRLSARGPRRPNDTEALEVFVTLTGTPPLRPGMRVDVYFYSPEEDAAEGKP